MKSLVTLCLLVVGPLLGVFSQHCDNGRPLATVVYELYSWRDDGGEWCFSILVNTNRAKTPEEIFDGSGIIRGIVQLKESISKMPHPAKLVWEKNPWEGTPFKSRESVTWPSAEIMNQLKRFAATKDIQVVWQELPRPD